jgi:hypothetical protein
LRKRNIALRHHRPRSKKRRSVVLSFLAITRRKLRYKETPQCFDKTTLPAAFLVKMGPQRIDRHAADPK